jgi:hypothetical protein
MERNRQCRVLVRACWQTLPHSDLNAQLFNQFTPQAFLQRLSLIDLATGEFPLERQAHGSASLGGKNKAVFLDNGAGDLDMLQGIWQIKRPPITNHLEKDVSIIGSSCLNFPMEKPPVCTLQTKAALI